MTNTDCNINNYIKLLRTLYDLLLAKNNACPEDYDSYIIDCLYLFEDTQEAKDDFVKYGVTGHTKHLNTGEIYLRAYGLLNACFLQKEALETCFAKLGIWYEKDKIDNAKIIKFRNIFGAHTPNKRSKDTKNKHSYILCRISLQEGKLKGYSSNRIQGETIFYSESGDIQVLLSEWDEVLCTKLRKIANGLFEKKSQVKIQSGCVNEYNNEYNKLNLIKGKIDDMSVNDNIDYGDIWNAKYPNIKITYIKPNSKV